MKGGFVDLSRKGGGKGSVSIWCFGHRCHKSINVFSYARPLEAMQIQDCKSKGENN